MRDDVSTIAAAKLIAEIERELDHSFDRQSH